MSKYDDDGEYYDSDYVDEFGGPEEEDDKKKASKGGSMFTWQRAHTGSSGLCRV